MWIFFFFPFPPSYVVLWDSKTPHRPASERVSWCLEMSPSSWLPPWDRSPSLTLFIFYILSYLLSKSILGTWCPLPAFRICVVEFAQCSNDLLMNLWGRGCGLPILFLCHLRTASRWIFFIYSGSQFWKSW